MSDERGDQDPAASGEPVVPPPPASPSPRIPPPPGSTEPLPSRVAIEPSPPEPTPPRPVAPSPVVVPGARAANPVAAAALVIGILALITGLFPFTALWGFALGVLALVLGGIAISKSRRGGVTGRGLAISGVIIGLLGLIAACVWIAIYLAQPDPVVADAQSVQEAAVEQQASVPVGTPRPVNGLAIGECFNSLQAAVVDQVSVIPCAQPHRSEVYAILDSPEGPGAPYPGTTVMRQAADGQCRADPYTDYIGGLDLFSRPQASAFHPNQERWAAGDRVIICTVSDPGAPGGLTTGSLRGSAERIGLPTSPQPSPPPTLVPRPLPPTPAPPPTPTPAPPSPG